MIISGPSRGQDRILRFRSREGGIPGEGLVLLDDVRGLKVGPVIPAGVTDRTALVVEFPLLRIPLGAVGLDPFLRTSAGDARTGRRHEHAVDPDVSLVRSFNSGGILPKWTNRVRETMSPPFRALTETIRIRSTLFSVGMGCRKREIRSSAADISVTGSIRSFQSSLQSLPTTSDSFSPRWVAATVFSSAAETRSPSHR